MPPKSFVNDSGMIWGLHSSSLGESMWARKKLGSVWHLFASACWSLQSSPCSCLKLRSYARTLSTARRAVVVGEFLCVYLRRTLHLRKSGAVKHQTHAPYREPVYRVMHFHGAVNWFAMQIHGRCLPLTFFLRGGVSTKPSHSAHAGGLNRPR